MGSRISRVFITGATRLFSSYLSPTGRGAGWWDATGDHCHQCEACA